MSVGDWPGQASPTASSNAGAAQCMQRNSARMADSPTAAAPVGADGGARCTHASNVAEGASRTSWAAEACLGGIAVSASRASAIARSAVDGVAHGRKLEARSAIHTGARVEARGTAGEGRQTPSVACIVARACTAAAPALTPAVHAQERGGKGPLSRVCFRRGRQKGPVWLPAYPQQLTTWRGMACRCQRCSTRWERTADRATQ